MISINRKAVRAAGGTQSDELQAKIKSVTSSTTIGACFIYDTRNDSDSGAWRKKTSHTSWAREAASATRSSRSKFPSVALIVADNGSTDTLTIYDLDDPSMPMWMVFNASGGYGAGSANLFGSTGDFTSIAALNGRVFVGKNNPNPYDAFTEINFVEDDTHYRRSDGKRVSQGIVSERNSGDRGVPVVEDATGAIASSNVNDVAATIVEGSELGALGLPIPTVAVACGPIGSAGGVSIIHPNGDVFSKTTTVVAVTKCEFTKSGLAVSQNDYIVRFANSELHANGSGSYPSSFVNNGTIQIIRQNGTAPSPNLLDTTNNDEGFVCTGGDDFATGSPDGLSLVKWNNGNPQEGAVAYVTSGYNSGYLLGDIRLALAIPYAAASYNYTNGASIGDRSVKNNDLTTSAASGEAVTASAVATGSEVFAFSGFSATEYLSKASTTDFDFGTGDFSIMFWVKTTNTATSENYVTRADSTPETGDFTVLKTGSNKLNFFIRDGNSWTLCAVSTSDIGSDWQQVVVARSGPLVSLYINGVREDSNTYSLTMTPSGGSEFRIGNRADSPSTPAADASLSLVRISATAPAPQQVKEIYEAEAPLFRAGAKCLLQSDGGSPNLVNDLSYDSTTGLLHAYQGGTNTAETRFKGLEAVDSYGAKSDGWSASGATGGVAAGGVKATYRAAATGGVIVDLPPFDVRGDTNIADSKLPDDGKFHFSGVTTNATPTAIGQIPIAENESYTVIARVMGLRYNAANSSIRHFCEIKQQFTRRVDGDVVEETQISKLEEGDWAALDAELDYDTGADTVQVKVTGDGSPSPGPYRVVWNATVEVQRISEKTYER